MRTIIIDDNVASVEVLVNKLKTYEDISVLGYANTCSKGIHLAAETNPELIFLDVELPDLSGLEFLSQLNHTVKGWCQVVMYTAHPGYMLSAFRVNAFDYLTKPIDDRELRNVIQRVIEKKNNDEQSPLMETVNSQYDKNKMLIYVNPTDFRLVHIHDICAFQYNHEIRQWEVLVAGRKDPITMKRTATCDLILGIDHRFIQVSQKSIINIDYLVEVVDNTCVFYPPFERIDFIKVGRMFRRKLTERFSQL